MTKGIIKLNTTGSCYIIEGGDYTAYSYGTPIYKVFYKKDGSKLVVFNNTYYSPTTRKHQKLIKDYKVEADLIVHYCPYGEWSLDTAFKNEITMTEYELEKLQNKTRKLGIRQAEKFESLKDRLQTLKKIYSEV